jgi:hypothetical protein
MKAKIAGPHDRHDSHEESDGCPGGRKPKRGMHDELCAVVAGCALVTNSSSCPTANSASSQFDQSTSQHMTAL